MRKCLLILWLFSLHTINATNFYCDPVNGSDLNNGSINEPWKDLQSVFENEKSFSSGDIIFLLSGNHGDVVIIGDNEKYVKIIGVDGANAVINSLVLGSLDKGAIGWTFSNIIFGGQKDFIKVLINENSRKIRFLENQFINETVGGSGIVLKGSNCKIESNVFSNMSSGIVVIGEKNQIRNNRIQYFNQFGIEVSGSFNLFEYNLIKENLDTDTIENSAVFFNENRIKGNIFRGNTIINFSDIFRSDLGVLNGFYGVNCHMSESVFENNVVVSNGVHGISLEGALSTIKIINNTVVNPYFGVSLNSTDVVNSQLAIRLEGKENSNAILVRNNLSNNFFFENIIGVADHNLSIPVSVHEYDDNFNNWALFDFSLNTNSEALNAGSKELAPKLDASMINRSVGGFVNIGAFEYSKVNESNEMLILPSEASDRQIHSKGKGDWDGQPVIRIGGVAEGIDGAAVFPFKIPTIPGGKEIISADFSVQVSKIDNVPEGGIDLYALAPKSNFWVTDDFYYQGIYGQDVNARPIQNNFINSNNFIGETITSNEGAASLKDYLNTINELDGASENFIFLRLNSNRKDVEDFNRWNLKSANSEDLSERPHLKLTIGYPKLNINANPSNSIENLIVTSADPINHGDLFVYFFCFKKEDLVNIKLMNFKGGIVFEETINPLAIRENVFRTKNLNLSTGKYILEYFVEGLSKKEVLFIW